MDANPKSEIRREEDLDANYANLPELNKLDWGRFIEIACPTYVSFPAFPLSAF